MFASTCSNYGLKTDGEPATEEADLNPQSLYVETKVNVEGHILNCKDDVGFCPTVLRVSTAYGLSPRMRFDLTVSEFVRELVTRKKVCVYDEDTWRPYCHVDDISEAIIKVIESPKENVSGEVFNVGSSDGNYTKKMIVETILSYLKEGEIEYQAGGFDRRDYRVSFDKVLRELGFQNRRSINQAVPNLIDAIRSGLFDDVEARTSFYGNYFIPGAE